MAGEGSRFVKEGYSIPKPLIEYERKMLFKRAVDSLSELDVPKKYSFIVRQEHIDNFNIDNIIKSYYPKATVFSVSKTTRGAIETCLMAISAIEVEDAILIMDCDIEFYSSQYNKSIVENLKELVNNVNGGMIVSFNADLSKYSYAEVDENGIVIRTAEKEVISNNALCGAYYFSKSEGFLSSAMELMNDTGFNKPEYYVSLLYNILIKRGEKVRLIKLDEYKSYGTPEELKAHL